MNGDDLIGRRRLLMGGLGLGGLGLIGAPTAASAGPAGPAGPREQGLPGSWLVNLTFNPVPPPNPTPAPLTAVNGFAAGGAFSAIVLSSPGGAPALGTWELTGHDSYEATVWQTENIGPNQTIALRVRLRGTFSPDRITSTFTFDAYRPPDLTTPILTGSGTSTGSRIVA
jgi:hypothetical protein